MKTTYQHPCKACGELAFSFTDGHIENKEYQWVCDHCGVQMSLTFGDAGRSVEQVPTGRRCDRTLALLCIEDYPAFKFIARGVRWDHDSDGHSYFFEEHTCPVNLLHCVEIFHKGESDPHGVFKLITEMRITGPGSDSEEAVTKLLTDMAEAETT